DAGERPDLLWRGRRLPLPDSEESTKAERQYKRGRFLADGSLAPEIKEGLGPGRVQFNVVTASPLVSAGHTSWGWMAVLGGRSAENPQDFTRSVGFKSPFSDTPDRRLPDSYLP